jgi:hypothetical protein
MISHGDRPGAHAEDVRRTLRRGRGAPRTPPVRMSAHWSPEAAWAVAWFMAAAVPAVAFRKAWAGRSELWRQIYRSTHEDRFDLFDARALLAFAGTTAVLGVAALLERYGSPRLGELAQPVTLYGVGMAIGIWLASMLFSWGQPAWFRAEVAARRPGYDHIVSARVEARSLETRPIVYSRPVHLLAPDEDPPTHDRQPFEPTGLICLFSDRLKIYRGLPEHPPWGSFIGRIARDTGVDEATVLKVLDFQDEYLFRAGILDVEDFELKFYEPDTQVEQGVLDVARVRDDAERLAGLDPHVTEKVLEAEYKYLTGGLDDDPEEDLAIDLAIDLALGLEIDLELSLADIRTVRTVPLTLTLANLRRRVLPRRRHLLQIVTLRGEEHTLRAKDAAELRTLLLDLIVLFDRRQQAGE